MKILKKLTSRRGETLIELLVSMAILTLSICFMVTMIMLSAKFDEQARSADKTYKDELNIAENFVGTPIETDKKVVMSNGVQNVEVRVDIYGTADGKLKSYKIHTP